MKITFLGAGSAVFMRRLLSDCMFAPALCDAHMALYDIDATRLKEAKQILDAANAGINQGRAKITTHLGPRARRTALRNANYVINAIQVGGYEPSTVIDFEIPTKYGLRQTIGDTLGIGGIFRALRTIPVMLEFAEDMRAVCPDAWMFNYTNPMTMLSTAMLRAGGIKYVGLCHSVQGCLRGLMLKLGMLDKIHEEVDLRDIGLADEGWQLSWKIAGINHQAWLLEAKNHGKDIYPELRRRAAKLNQAALAKKGEKHSNMVRLEMMKHFGYYVTESSEHCAEYSPYWIKERYPELIEQYNIPLDEYPRRCRESIEKWKNVKDTLNDLPKYRTHEYGSYILEAMETDRPMRIHGNIMNDGLIENLPRNVAVEVPCMVDRNGINGCHVGVLPEQCAALNRTNINVQLLAVEAALSLRREHIYHAAFLDPHTAAELPLDKIKAMVDDLIKAHGKMLPRYK